MTLLNLTSRLLPPLSQQPCSLLLTDLAHILCTEPPTTKTAALQFVSQATERQTDRRTIRQPAAATEGDEAEGVSHDPADSPRGNCSQLPRNNNNINKSSRNLRYLCCEYTINIVAPSGIDLAHSIGRTDSSHSLCPCQWRWQCQCATPPGHISTHSDVRHLSPLRQHQLMPMLVASNARRVFSAHSHSHSECIRFEIIFN